MGRRNLGTGQGQIISPLLAKLYLHHVLDMWFEKGAKPRLRGEAYEIRYADDALLCFQFKKDAERVLEILPKRFAKYGLTLHSAKTRLVKFGRSAHYQAKREVTKTATFDFWVLRTGVKLASRENSRCTWVR